MRRSLCICAFVLLAVPGTALGHVLRTGDARDFTDDWLGEWRSERFSQYQQDEVGDCGRMSDHRVDCYGYAFGKRIVDTDPDRGLLYRHSECRFRVMSKVHGHRDYTATVRPLTRKCDVWYSWSR